MLAKREEETKSIYDTNENFNSRRKVSSTFSCLLVEFSSLLETKKNPLKFYALKKCKKKINILCCRKFKSN